MAATPTDLAEAELRIFQAKRQLGEQADRLARAQGQGRLEDSAKAMLLAMELTLANLVAYRNNIAAELDRQASASPPASTMILPPES